MKHGQIKTSTPQDDGSVKIVTEGYYDELNSVKEEIRMNINTTTATLMRDIIKALETFTMTDTPEITLTIHKHKGEPQRIVKSYVVYKKKL